MRTNYKIVNKRKSLIVKNTDRLLKAASVLGIFKFGIRDALTDNQTRIKRILLIRLAYIGDVVLTLPVIEALANSFPNAQIDFLTSNYAAPLLKNYPNLHNILEYNASWFYGNRRSSPVGSVIETIRSNKYDLGIDFRGDIRNIYYCMWRPSIPRRLSYSSGGGRELLTHCVEWHQVKHKVEFHLDILRNIGIDTDHTDPKIFLTETEVESAGRLLASKLPGNTEPILAIHPGARLELKRWPVERFCDLVQTIRKQNLGAVVLVGSQNEIDISRVIKQTAGVSVDLTGQLSIRELAAVLKQCECLVCHDSAPMHIAAAVGTKVVALFGPSRPLETAPCGTGHQIIEGDCPKKDFCDENKCDQDWECIQSISMDKVINGCVRLLYGS